MRMCVCVCEMRKMKSLQIYDRETELNVVCFQIRPMNIPNTNQFFSFFVFIWQLIHIQDFRKMRWVRLEKNNAIK
jgi:hypothetical protein